MIHEFNMNGYIYTEIELNSGKNYKMIMKKIKKISKHHIEKEERDNDLMQIPIKRTIEEKANSKTGNLHLTQEISKAKEKLFLVGSLMMVFLAIVIVILLAYGFNPWKDITSTNEGVSV